MVKLQLSHLVTDNADFIRDMYSASIADYDATSATALTNEGIPTFLYGIRGKAFTIYNLVPTIASVLGVSALPVLASSWVVKDKIKIKKNIDSIIKLTALIAMPAGFGLISVGGPVMQLLYKSAASVEIGGPMLQIFGVAAIFAGLSIPITSMLQAIGKQNVPVLNIAIGAVIKIIVNYILVGIPSINVLGAPIGTLCCYLFIFLANIICLIKFTGIIPSITKVFIKPLIASALCGAAAFAVTKLNSSNLVTVGAICVAGVVYLVALIALNTFEEEDFLALPGGNKLLKICKRYKILR